MSDKKKILIIDDDKDYGEALRIVLENNGYEVNHALNIDDGRKVLDDIHPKPHHSRRHDGQAYGRF